MKSFMAAGVATILALSLQVDAALAQAAEAPTIADIPAKQTLPADGTFDFVGLSLGAPFSEIMAKFKEIAPNAQPNITKLSSGVGDNRGNSVHFAYEPFAAVSVTNTDGSREDFEAIFTTKINSARAVKLKRYISYSSATQQGSVPALLEGLTQKYGPASYIERSSNSIELVYIWFDGKRVTLTEQMFRSQRYTSGTPASCINVISDVSQYGFAGNRQDPRPGCNATIRVRVSLGTRTDLISNVNFEMADKVRFFKNGTDTDAWLSQELEKKIAGQSGAKAPKL